MPLLTTEVSNGRLILGVKPNTNFKTNNPVNYTLTVKDLSDLQSSGSVYTIINGIKSSKLTVALSGAGSIDISGKVDHQNLIISGSGSYPALELESNSAKLLVTGVSKASVHAVDTLNVTISGVGQVTYKGSPQITQKISGIGSIKSL